MMICWKKRKRAAVRTLLYLVLLMLVIGCGGTTTTSPSASTVNGVDLASLFHIDTGPVACTFDPFFQDWGNLVLKAHPNSYDSPELQQLESYARALGGGKPEAPLPSTLD